tara:strand:+ start:1848 stop:2588 length:741 start_codon:yes stop_codon:yes gene_type:complete
MRTVILHYHLFKNAGTSMDATLNRNFPDDLWVTREFPSDPKSNAEQLKQWIIDEPQAICFSSHTAFLPPPEIENVTIIPVIFMRHPIDRIISAYSFERNQRADNFGSTLARNTTLSGYIETRLSMPNDHQCRNFHVEKFSRMFGKGDNPTQRLVNAKKAIEALPFVGDVGDFDNSIKRLEALLKDNGLEVDLTAERKNVSRQPKTIDEKLKSLHESMGDELYNKLMAANKEDLELYEFLRLSNNKQ